MFDEIIKLFLVEGYELSQDYASELDLWYMKEVVMARVEELLEHATANTCPLENTVEVKSQLWFVML